MPLKVWTMRCDGFPLSCKEIWQCQYFHNKRWARCVCLFCCTTAYPYNCNNFKVSLQEFCYPSKDSLLSLLGMHHPKFTMFLLHFFYLFDLKKTATNECTLAMQILTNKKIYLLLSVIEAQLAAIIMFTWKSPVASRCLCFEILLQFWKLGCWAQ